MRRNNVNFLHNIIRKKIIIVHNEFSKILLQDIDYPVSVHNEANLNLVLEEVQKAPAAIKFLLILFVLPIDYRLLTNIYFNLPKKIIFQFKILLHRKLMYIFRPVLQYILIISSLVVFQNNGSQIESI